MPRRIALLIACVAALALARAQAVEPTPSAESSPSIDRTQYDEGCLRDCATFRRECIPYCKSRGRVPNSRVDSRDCRGDCAAFEAQCLEACERGYWRRYPPLER